MSFFFLRAIVCCSLLGLTKIRSLNNLHNIQDSCSFFFFPAADDKCEIRGCAHDLVSSTRPPSFAQLVHQLITSVSGNKTRSKWRSTSFGGNTVRGETLRLSQSAVPYLVLPYGGGEAASAWGLGSRMVAGNTHTHSHMRRYT